MSRISKKFSHKLRNLRMDKGWSQLKLADKANLDVTTVNEIENGRRDPMLGTVKKIAKALNVSLSTLIDL